MTSKLVLTNQKATRSLVEAAATNAPAIDDAFTAASRALPRRKSAAQPAASALLGFMADVLEHRTTQLIEADEALARELADDAEPRERRDNDAARLSTELVEIRATLSGGATHATVRNLGFLGATPADPTELVALARRVSKNAATVKLEPRRKGVKLDLAELVASLATLADAVDKATRDVAREERERHEALRLRDNALANWNRAYQGVAGTLEGVLTFAGLDELAKRVRPLLRRAGSGGDGDEGTDESAPGNPTEPKP